MTNKELVHRLVDEVMNGRNFQLLDDLCTPPLAAKLRHAFDQFVVGFPDWHQQLIELVAEADTVVARFQCHGTHTGTWDGLPPSGRIMRIDEVYFFRFTDGRISAMWGLEDTGPSIASSPATTSPSENWDPSATRITGSGRRFRTPRSRSRRRHRHFARAPHSNPGQVDESTPGPTRRITCPSRLSVE